MEAVEKIHEEAWNKHQSREELRKITTALCSCGGGEPGHCCDVCTVWHAYLGREIPDRKEGELPDEAYKGPLCEQVPE